MDQFNKNEFNINRDSLPIDLQGFIADIATARKRGISVIRLCGPRMSLEFSPKPLATPEEEIANNCNNKKRTGR